MMGSKIYVSVSMGWLSANIDSNDSISTGDQSVEKGNLSLTFGLNGKRDVCVKSYLLKQKSQP